MLLVSHLNTAQDSNACSPVFTTPWAHYTREYWRGGGNNCHRHHSGSTTKTLSENLGHQGAAWPPISKAFKLLHLFLAKSTRLSLAHVLWGQLPDNGQALQDMGFAIAAGMSAFGHGASPPQWGLRFPQLKIRKSTSKAIQLLGLILTHSLNLLGTSII